MTTLDVKKLKRDTDYFKQVLLIEDDVVYTNRDISILFPAKYVDKGLAELGNTTETVLIVGVVDLTMNKYYPIKIPGKFKLQPENIESVVINNIEYIKLDFEEGMPVIASMKTVVRADFMFELFNYYLIQGKIPWYLDYQDVKDIFLKIEKYTGSKTGRYPLTYELLTSVIARTKEDKLKEYRNYVNENSENKDNLYWIGLENIFYSFNSTISKIAGSYMELGLISALNYPESEISTLEHVLRE